MMLQRESRLINRLKNHFRNEEVSFRRKIKVGFLLLLLSLAPLASGEGLPDLSWTPLNCDPSLSAELSRERTQLVEGKNKLKAEIAVNKANCKSVETGSALEAECQKENIEIKRRFEDLVAGYNDFNQRVASAKKTKEAEAAKVGSNTKSAEPYVPSGPSGGVAAVSGEVYFFTSSGRKIKVSQGGTIPLDGKTRVVVGNNGRLQMLLPDETIFTLGPDSDMVIDEFVYDPKTSAGKMSATIVKGAFRFVSGKVKKAHDFEKKILTAVMCIGIRGTDFKLLIQPDGSGYLKLRSGLLEITENKTGSKFPLKGGQDLNFQADGTLAKPEPLKK